MAAGEGLVLYCAEIERTPNLCCTQHLAAVARTSVLIVRKPSSVLVRVILNERFFTDFSDFTECGGLFPRIRENEQGSRVEGLFVLGSVNFLRFL